MKCQRQKNLEGRILEEELNFNVVSKDKSSLANDDSERSSIKMLWNN